MIVGGITSFDSPLGSASAMESFAPAPVSGIVGGGLAAASYDTGASASQAQVAQVISQIYQGITAIYAAMAQPVHAGSVLAQSSEDSTYEARVIALVNAERAREGLRPLSYDARLDLASERHNQTQMAAITMAHSGIGDGSPVDRVRAAGFSGAWGENVATGQRSPEQVVREWMESPGHRRNIMDPNFSRIGVSYNVAIDGRSYWAQTFGA